MDRHAFIRLPLYPLRMIWSAFLYPIQFDWHKQPKDAENNTITHTKKTSFNPNAHNTYIIYAPGRSEHKMTDQCCLPSNINIDNLSIEVIPPPCYHSPWIPFSLHNWANSITERANIINQLDPEAQIICWGTSMGGAATLLASQKPIESTKYVVVNTFSSFTRLLWSQPSLSVTILFLHLLPTGLVLFFIGLGQQSSLFTAGIIISSLCLCAFVAAALCILNLKYDISRRLRQYFFHITPSFLTQKRPLYTILLECICTTCCPYQRLTANLTMLLPKLLIRFVVAAILLLYAITYLMISLLYASTRITAHLLTAIMLWGLHAYQDLQPLVPSHNPLIKSTFIFQAEQDELVLPSAQLINSKYTAENTQMIAGGHTPSNEVLQEILKTVQAH